MMGTTVEPTTIHMLSYSDGQLVGSFLRKEDAEFARDLWQEYGLHTGMMIHEVIATGDVDFVIGDDL